MKIKRQSFLKRHKVLTALLVFGVVLGTTSVVAASTSSTSLKTPQTGSVMPLREGLLTFTNKERAKVGSKALVIDGRLNTSAQLKAEEMERTGVFGHVAPDGKRGATYIEEQGMKCTPAGENLIEYNITLNSHDAIRGWMESKAGHREALLNSEYDLVGFGVTGSYVVQHFCDL